MSPTLRQRHLSCDCQCGQLLVTLLPVLCVLVVLYHVHFGCTIAVVTVVSSKRCYHFAGLYFLWLGTAAVWYTALVTALPTTVPSTCL